jgi:hypothetical protein
MTVKRCDKTTADPAKHRGPFRPLFVFENSRGGQSADSCAACGNTVLLELAPADDNKSKPDRPEVKSPS